MTEDSTVDVLVAGGGPAGGAVAIGLARMGRSAVLVESSAYTGQRVGESLVPGVQPLLHDLGAWDACMGTSPMPSFGTKSIWNCEGDIESHSHVGSPYQNGWQVDRAAFDAALVETASDVGADVVLNERIVDVGFDGATWRLRSNSGREWRARVLVDATGRSARVGRLVGVAEHRFDHLVAVGGVGYSDVSPSQLVLVEAVLEGWWYSAPVPDGGIIAMLMTDKDVCAQDGLARPENWLDCMRRAPNTSQRTGTCAFGNARAHAAHSVRHRRRNDDRLWLSVGDAGLAVDPLSGTGVIRSLRSAREAVVAIQRALEGDHAAINAYEIERDLECQAYLHERLDYYAQGPRFPSTFWARRHDAVERREQSALATA